MPQHRFASIHVVGTNGKSSVAMMTSALLEAHGIRTGTYLSPHPRRWSERIRLRGEEIGESELAGAVERVATSVAVVNRGLEEGESVTQFEALTAAAFVALAAGRVQVAVIEAGLGGRLDATNVIPSRVTALTTVGLEHTQWLGGSVEEIAAEKLAVLRDHTTLVVGDLDPGLAALAERTASQRHARLVTAPRLPADVRLAAVGPSQRRNFALAAGLAGAFAGRLDPARVRSVAAALRLPGRVEVREGDPPMILDGAHNPAGARALGEALAEVVGERPVVACLAVLADKDAAAMLAELAPRLAAAVCTEIPASELGRAGRPGATTIAAARLAMLAREAGVEATEHVGEPRAAIARARRLAAERGGVALVSGSHYLLRHGDGS
jgi:dihydrofolate synthase / folylpolyglutamate synthase